MFHLKVRFGLLLTVLALALPAWAEETIDSVEKKLAEASGKIKAISYKMTMVMDMKFEGGSMKSESVTLYELQKAGEKFKSRSDTKTSGVTNMGGQEMKTDSTALVICDGEFAYTLSETMGQKMAQKAKLDPAQDGLNLKSTFALLRKDYNLKVLPDEKADGRDCFVIEAAPKDASSAGTKLVYHFAKDLGLMVKYVAYGKDGKPTTTMTTTDVKLDPTFPPDRFNFKAPAGVEVTDRTKETTPEKQ
jgi:outer membrane lipoprotein-sorting protein